MMSNYDFVPSSDSKFDVWQGNLMLFVEPNVEAWGIYTDDFASLKTLQAVWINAYAKASNRKNRTSVDVRAKVDARKPYEKDLRSFVAQWLSKNHKVTDSDRSRMGLTVKSGTHTPVAAPASSPVGKIDFSVRQQHTIRFVDSLTGGKAKPYGVLGCEIWIKNGGEAPREDSDFDYLGITTKSPYKITFAVAEIGKAVYYRMRWLNTRGKTGPWSSTISAVIGG